MKAVAATMLVIGVLVVGLGLAPTSAGAAAPVATTDWPQFRGPNGDSVAPSSPKLLDKWPTSGPARVWKSDELPFAPTCGVGSPVVAGANVYTYAQVALPQDGIKPFGAEFLTEWGWAPDMPAELGKQIDKAIYLYAKGGDGVIDISPFSCMNGIVSEAVYHSVSRDHDAIPIRNFYFDSTSSNMERDLDIFMELAASYQKRKRTRREFPKWFD